MSTRRFWQIHLSTAVVLMFVAATMLWINTAVHRERVQISDGALELLINVQDGWGWPLLYSHRDCCAWAPKTSSRCKIEILQSDAEEARPICPYTRETMPLIINFFAVAMLVIALGAMLEWTIFRRANGR